jgi:NAD(P)-dependent dehydrogenase (short-subunit alcohol dehydrogenase family)
MGVLDGKVALITGGASGFGRGASTLFAEEGAKVAIADINTDAGNDAVAEIKKKGGNAIFIKTDVTNADQVAKAVSKTVDVFGKLTVLYNNAGILGARDVPLTDYDDRIAEKLLSVNILGVYLPTKHAVPAMIEAGGGSIINTGSDSAFRGNAQYSVYSCTKAAVIAFSRVVAIEYVGKGIRSNTVSPGIGRTPMHAELLQGAQEAFKGVEQLIPMKRAALPIDIARAAVFFASDASSYITGENLMVDGGWTARGYF